MHKDDLLNRKETPANSIQPAVNGARPASAVKWLSLRLWLVMFLIGALLVLSEVIDHSRMHQVHGSGASLLEDGEFIREVIMYGLVAPILAGLLLTRLDRAGAQRDAIARELEDRRAFVKQLNDATEWEQLVDLITSSPGVVTSASNAYFMVQRSPVNEFNLISRWRRAGTARTPASPPVSPAECETCAAGGPGDPSVVVPCPLVIGEELSEGVTRYCMCLAAGDSQKAVLAFDLPNNETIQDRQARTLGDMGPVMAKALENANLLHRELEQAEATKSERLRIARYLHDTLGQNVSFLRLKLDQMSTSGSLSEIADIQQEIEQMRDVANEAYDQIRHTLSDLHDTDPLSLGEALQINADKVAARAGFEVRLISDGVAKNLSPYVQRQVLYVSREALNNVEKHAKAGLVLLTVDWREQELVVTIADDGIGFQPDLIGRGHYGMMIMDERARALNGSLRISSALGAGTEVSLRLPLPPQSDYGE